MRHCLPQVEVDNIRRCLRLSTLQQPLKLPRHRLQVVADFSHHLRLRTGRRLLYPLHGGSGAALLRLLPGTFLTSPLHCILLLLRGDHPRARDHPNVL